MSDLQGLSPCCISGSVHEGELVGSEIKIAGLDAYVSGGGSGVSKVIIVLPDVFGYKIKNIRLLADEFARTKEFKVIVPDIFQGDSVDYKHIKPLVPLHSDPTPSEEKKIEALGSIIPWSGRHGDDVARPLIQGVLEAVRAEEGVGKIGVVGFCWGGTQALHLASIPDNGVDAVVVNHPGRPGMNQFEEVCKPTLLQVGDNDPFFPDDQISQVKENIFPTKKDAEVLIYPGGVHGFACRGDLNNDAESQIQEEATIKAIEFFRKHLA